MQKKTLNINILETADYSEEEYREFIREAGFDPDELYIAFGQFIEKIDKFTPTRQNISDSDELNEKLQCREGVNHTGGSRITDFLKLEVPRVENVRAYFNRHNRTKLIRSESVKENGVIENN